MALSINVGDTLYLVLKLREPQLSGQHPSIMICSIHTTYESADATRMKRWSKADAWVDVIELQE